MKNEVIATIGMASSPARSIRVKIAAQRMRLGATNRFTAVRAMVTSRWPRKAMVSTPSSATFITPLPIRTVSSWKPARLLLDDRFGLHAAPTSSSSRRLSGRGLDAGQVEVLAAARPDQGVGAGGVEPVHLAEIDLAVRTAGQFVGEGRPAHRPDCWRSSSPDSTTVAPSAAPITLNSADLAISHCLAVFRELQRAPNFESRAPERCDPSRASATAERLMAQAVPSTAPDEFSRRGDRYGKAEPTFGQTHAGKHGPSGPRAGLCCVVLGWRVR